MAKKSVFRSVFKWLPISIEQIQATTTDGGVSRYNADAKSDSVDDLIEVEFVAAEDHPVDEAAVNAAVDDLAERMKGE